MKPSVRPSVPRSRGISTTRFQRRDKRDVQSLLFPTVPRLHYACCPYGEAGQNENGKSQESRSQAVRSPLDNNRRETFARNNMRF